MFVGGRWCNAETQLSLRVKFSHHGFRRFEGRRMKDRDNFGAEKLVFLRCDVGKSDRVKPKMSGTFWLLFGHEK